MRLLMVRGLPHHLLSEPEGEGENVHLVPDRHCINAVYEPETQTLKPWSRFARVGDFGYFPDHTRLDKATIRHAAADPMELGVQLVTAHSRPADEVFHGEEVPPEGLWFTAGNHEDFEALAERGRESEPRDASFPVDAYRRVHCIRDGIVEHLPGNCGSVRCGRSMIRLLLEAGVGASRVNSEGRRFSTSAVSR